MIKISPSLLSSDYMNMEKDIRAIERAGCPYVHVDVMDGHFVPNINFGPSLVAALRKTTDIVLDVHLMISEPHKYIDAFIDAGADIITVHIECDSDFEEMAAKVKDAGRKFAISINPPTDVKNVCKYAELLDMVLVMSVNPGFGAQAFIESSLDKIEFLRKEYPELDIEVDGGIKLDNVERVVNAGANVIVAGSAIFGGQDVTKNAQDFIKRCNK